MLQHVWDRWHDEYLNTLINRSKWIREQRNLKEGDLVIVKEENIHPMAWKMARIQEVLPEKDNNIIIRTSSGVHKRPITKLGVLYQQEE